MMRLLGVLVGSALAVGALVVFVGIPEFTTEQSIADKPIITLPMRPAAQPDLQAGSDPEPPPDVGAAAAGEASLTESPGDSDAALAAAEPGSAGPPPQPAMNPDAPLEPPVDAAVALQAGQEEPLHWYAFWSPFRSEIAAAGFVDQLQRVTGLDYRVVKVKPGVYEVAFAYADDDEINVNLSQITAATGLQLPEG